jgi:hypothetical protein
LQKPGSPEIPLKDGTQVPGASTICQDRRRHQWLIHWAWNLGMEGQDYRKVRDKAADIGTVAHFMIECHFLHNHEPDLSEFSPPTLSAQRRLRQLQDVGGTSEGLHGH